MNSYWSCDIRSYDRFDENLPLDVFSVSYIERHVPRHVTSVFIFFFNSVEELARPVDSFYRSIPIMPLAGANRLEALSLSDASLLCNRCFLCQQFYRRRVCKFNFFSCVCFIYSVAILSKLSGHLMFLSSMFVWTLHRPSNEHQVHLLEDKLLWINLVVYFYFLIWQTRSLTTSLLGSKVEFWDASLVRFCMFRNHGLNIHVQCTSQTLHLH